MQQRKQSGFDKRDKRAREIRRVNKMRKRQGRRREKQAETMKRRFAQKRLIPLPITYDTKEKL